MITDADTDSDTDVVVVGAGPTGLTLALQCVALGARVRVVERRSHAFRPSRAFIVHPRTLELLRPLGVADRLVDSGEQSPRVDLHLGGRVVPAQLGPFALDDTPYPFLLFAPQAAVESVLIHALKERGVTVEWGTAVTGLRQDRAGVQATLTSDRPGRGVPATTVRCRYLVGCDGSDSMVRGYIGARWVGRPYRQEVVLADVELSTPLCFDVAQMAVGTEGLVFAMTLLEQATWRVLATRPADTASKNDAPVSGAEIQRFLDDADLNATVHSVAWSDRIPLEHRLASSYRRGEVFIAGDAAHTHSPAGGQGMNAGIQDAVNLGWKLAFAVSGPADHHTETLLDSYQRERRPVARRTLATTRALFWVEAGDDPLARILRAAGAPVAARLAPIMLGRRRLMAQGIRMLSQLRISYRSSPICEPNDSPAGRRPRCGERIPDQSFGNGRHLYDVMAVPGVHLVFDAEAPPTSDTCFGPWVHVHRRLDRAGRGVVGVRPDGYVGYTSREVDVDAIKKWLTSIGARQ